MVLANQSKFLYAFEDAGGMYYPCPAGSDTMLTRQLDMVPAVPDGTSCPKAYSFFSSKQDLYEVMPTLCGSKLAHFWPAYSSCFLILVPELTGVTALHR